MKILILGSTGFVGRNLVEALSSSFSVIRPSRNPDDQAGYFDLANSDSWNFILDAKPDVIINAAAYGVIKNEKDIELTYATNYLMPAGLLDFLSKNGLNCYWLQLGTAFEYDLTIVGGLTEETRCLPRTHYGISKLMFSQYLLQMLSPGKFSILRPFGMFGKYEDESKFFPMLIKSQSTGQEVKLSAGTQQRDYCFVEDVTKFIHFALSERLGSLPPILNLGSGQAKSLRDYATVLGSTIHKFDPTLLHWDTIDFRGNESSLFYNSSSMAKSQGFQISDLRASLARITPYYWTEK